MDRITSLERVLNPVTQPVQRYRPHTSKEFEQYSLQRPPIYFGSGIAIHVIILTKLHNINTTGTTEWRFTLIFFPFYSI